ncbi:Dimethylaniline monooxygenase N-oxide-forming [Penicillium maclennaniae]|uniref:Dimethylaniline monooxygenase N-oxide-forming n=1 Tax=Penicillium maclennaniae TaxID=1343394 RepID=UPI0025424A65|nr:Dimethylaniline monooxygenase N-oxide-forming [Penicillium maclennaniae]KAJ5674393.1 Dimethylaniline monooxygenase N-oxide-forming [Penicillium maclennaniae]
MNESTINRVAVIGAGISGIVSAAQLLAAGLQVTVFERSQAAGGVWLFDKRVPIEAHYPNCQSSDVGRYSRDDRSENEQKILIHAPRVLAMKVLPTTSRPRCSAQNSTRGQREPRTIVLKEYIQDTSKKTGVDNVTIYGALVKQVYKTGQEWHVHWTTLEQDSNSGHIAEQQNTAVHSTWQFDAVVVGSGHYHTPLIPDITGLAEAKAKWPAKITHSK